MLQEELVRLLTAGGAHVTFEEAVANIPKKYYGAPVAGIPYTLWRILQHMRISQRDILEYIRNPNYQEMVWPDDYWPKEPAPPSDRAWKNCIKEIRQDLKEIVAIIQHPKTNFFEPLPYVKNGPCLLREILLVADHNSYHIGQLILLRGLLGIWED